MFAVVKIGGHQHKIKKGDIFLTELSEGEPEKEFDCKEILLVGEGENVRVGNPTVQGAAVRLKVLAAEKGPKLRGYWYKKRKGTQKTWGHRQHFHRLQVVEIRG